MSSSVQRVKTRQRGHLLSVVVSLLFCLCKPFVHGWFFVDPWPILSFESPHLRDDKTRLDKEVTTLVA